MSRFFSKILEYFHSILLLIDTRQKEKYELLKKFYFDAMKLIDCSVVLEVLSEHQIHHLCRPNEVIPEAIVSIDVHTMHHLQHLIEIEHNYAKNQE